MGNDQPHPAQHLAALPDEALVYLLPSRYCEVDSELMQLAWNQFGNTPEGWARVQAICDYVHGHIRFDYMRTLHDWCENLKANWDEAVALVGENTAKLWGMYMAGSEWGFEHDVVELHQVVGIKLASDGSRAGTPERRWWNDSVF